jgi:hypothetical protein
MWDPDSKTLIVEQERLKMRAEESVLEIRECDKNQYYTCIESAASR